MSKDEYLITDTPLKALTVFAMPMILGSFFQQVYNMADSIIVGQFVGSSALAAVGACAALTNVFICVALGAGVGAGVFVSRYFGAREYSKMKTIVSTSLISFLVLSIFLCVFGFGFSHAMMSLLQTPAGRCSSVFAGLFCGIPISVYVQHSFYHVYFYRGIKDTSGTSDIFFCSEHSYGSLDGGRPRPWRLWSSACDTDCTGDFRSDFVVDFLLSNASI